jgi:hypothetical protein
MAERLTRRRALAIGTTILAGAVAGCSGLGGDGDGNGNGDGGGATTTQTPGGGGGTTTQSPGGGSSDLVSVVVGEVGAVGPLELLVTDVERLDSAPILGFPIRADEGNVFVAATLAMKNAGDRHAAFVLDGLAVAVDGAVYASEQLYVDIWSPDFGGLPLAPGELRVFPLYFEVPDGVGNGQLRVVSRARSLPDDFAAATRFAVDLDAAAGSPASLSQTLTLDLLSVGESAAFGGLSATVVGVSYPEAVQGQAPPEGFEYVAVSLSATHGADFPNRMVVGLGGVGGMGLQDDAGGVFDDRVRFTGTIDGGREFFATNGIAPGETREGVSVVTVPEGVEPLYLTWSPPPLFWVPPTGAASNRAVWRVR